MTTYRIEEHNLAKAGNTIELGDDDILLTARPHFGTHKIIIARAVEETYRCGSRDTSDGEPCKVRVETEDGKCWRHE